MLTLLLFVLVVAVCILSAIMLCVMSINRWLERRNQRKIDRLPHLFRCMNNGVHVLARLLDRREACDIVRSYRDQGQKIAVWDIPIRNLMIFTDHEWQKNIRTGTMNDMDKLIRGCVVQEAFLYVPFSNGIRTDKEERERYPFVSLEDAYYFVHGRTSAMNQEFPPAIVNGLAWPTT